MKVKLLLPLLLFLFVGCSSFHEVSFSPPPSFPVPDELQPLNFKYPEMEIETAEPIFLDKNFDITNKEHAAFVAFGPEQFKKIVKLKQAFSSQKDILLEQKQLLNSYIAQINGSNRIIQLKDQQIKEIYSMYQTAELNYKQEKHDHKMDSILDRISIYALGVLNIILVISTM